MDKPVGRNISIQQIEIFLRAVELCNFSKAAATLNFTPSMVSKTILSMENELGIELFVRRPHELTPTPAARMLASEWRRLVGSYDYAVTKARAIQLNRLFRLQISFVDSSDQIDDLMKQALSRYEELYPSAEVIVEKHDMHRAAELIHFGLLDLAVTSAIEIPYLKEHRISYEQLMPTSTMVYIPEKTRFLIKKKSAFRILGSSRLPRSTRRCTPAITAGCMRSVKRTDSYRALRPHSARCAPCCLASSCTNRSFSANPSPLTGAARS